MSGNLSQIYAISINGLLIEAIDKISDCHVRCIFAVTADNRVVGTISSGDVIRALLNGASIHSPLVDWIHTDFIFLEKRDMERARVFMEDLGITLIPVLDSQRRLSSVITLNDVLRNRVA